MKDFSQSPEVTVTSFREAMLWAGEHGREVLYLAPNEDIAQSVKRLLRDRLGRRARLVRIEVQSARSVLGSDREVEP